MKDENTEDKIRELTSNISNQQFQKSYIYMIITLQHFKAKNKTQEVFILTNFGHKDLYQQPWMEKLVL